MKCLLCLIFSCIVLFPICASTGLFPITICSVYLDSRTGQWGSEVRWAFTEISRGKVQVTQEGSEDPVVLLKYDQSGRLQRVEKRIGLGDKKIPVIETPSGPLVLSEGFPVPFDHLAPHDDSIRQAVIKKKAGGATFSFQVARDVLEITLDAAMAENMIDEQMARSLAGKGLKLITVRKGEELLVRQLWPEGASWWVYEETPIRKSWRVPSHASP
jgi:hypothetical protein